MSYTSCETLTAVENVARKTGRSLHRISNDEIQVALLTSVVSNTHELCETLKEINAHLRSIALSATPNKTGRALDNSNKGDAEKRST